MTGQTLRQAEAPETSNRNKYVTSLMLTFECLRFEICLWAWAPCPPPGQDSLLPMSDVGGCSLS